MSCSRSKEIMLYFYDELDDEARLSIEAHLQACPSCRKELEGLEEMRSRLPAPLVSDEILQPTRRALLYKLRRSQTKGSTQIPIWQHAGKLVFQAGLAAALIFFGFWLGGKNSLQTVPPQFSMHDLITASKAVVLQNDAISPYLMGINRITVNANDGTVEIEYNTVNEVTIRGGADDRDVTIMLQNALQSEEDPVLRLRAVKAVEAMAATADDLDTVLVDALGHLLQNEKNIGIKLSALDALQFAVNTPQGKKIIIQTMLSDKNDVVRMKAFKTLIKSDEPISKMSDVLTTTRSDSNVYIRTKSLQLLEKGKDSLL